MEVYGVYVDLISHIHPVIMIQMITDIRNNISFRI